MINEKSKKRNKQKEIFFSILIIIISTLLITVIIGLKIEPIKQLVDDDKIATRDMVLDEDYYDENATLLKAEEAKNNIEKVVLKLNEKTYSAFEEVIKYFNITDTYRTSMSLAYQSNYSTIEDRQEIIDNYISYTSNIGINIDESIAKTLLSEIALLEYENYKSNYKILFANNQSNKISEENLSNNILELKNNIEKVITNSNLILLSEAITNKFLRVNSIVDDEATLLLQENIYDDVINNFPVIIKKDTKLTIESEVVSNETIKLLNDMNLMGTSINIQLYASLLALVVLMLLPVITYKRMMIKNYKITPKQLIMIYLVVIVLFILAYLIPKEYYLILPVIAVPMILSMLTNHKIAVIITIPLAILLTIMQSGDIIYMTMIVVGGIVSIYLVKNTNNRLKFAATGIIVGVLNVFILLIVSLISNIQIQSLINDFTYVIVAGLISSIISLGLLPVFESLFSIVTPFKLLELSNPSKQLINRLLIEAPGTYHHSLMVGNLSEAGAKAIGANGLLARVGAYYHDVGKLKRPLFFSENQTEKENPHDKMTPSLSTFVITNHTKDGFELAKKHKLPLVIRNIIKEHHGTTLVQYFYHKASQVEEVNEKDFRYPGPRPTTKESAVVMLADTIEASIRSMNKETKGEIEGFIRKQIKEKLDDGQLALVDLTFKDIDDIADAFARVFSGYFHSRIQYPEKQEVITDEPKN